MPRYSKNRPNQLYDAIPEEGSIGNIKLRNSLEWPPELYERVKTELLEERRIIESRETRGGQLSRVLTFNNTAEILPFKETSIEEKRANIFIVHGHSDAKYDVKEFLKEMGLNPVILHEQANEGHTLISKFEEHSESCKFAIVIMTPDDEGKAKDDSTLKFRARQNVIFELGFFIGKLGMQKVVALVKNNVERPSDYDGVLYIDYDNGVGWKIQLGRELKKAGYKIDLNRIC